MGASAPVMVLMNPIFTCARPTPGRASASAARTVVSRFVVMLESPRSAAVPLREIRLPPPSTLTDGAPPPPLWRTATRRATAPGGNPAGARQSARADAPFLHPREIALAARARRPASGVPGAVRAEAPIVLKFSHVVAVDTPKGQAAEFFRRRAEELTGGRVRVEVYPNSTLYKDREEIEALQLGAVQMLAPSLSKFGPLGVREFEVFDLPFLFSDADAAPEGHPGAGRQGAPREARAEGDRRPRVLGQRLQVLLGAAAAARPRRTSAACACASSPRSCSTRRCAPSGRCRRSLGVLGRVPGAPRRGGGGGGEPHLEPLHAAHARGAAAPHGHGPRLPRLRGHREQALLGRTARRRARAARASRWRRRPSTRTGSRARRTTRTSRRCARRARPRSTSPTPAERLALKRALVPVHAQMEERIGRELIEAIYRATGFKPDEL